MRSSFCFSVRAAADPSTLPRVSEVLSVYGIVPQRCHCQAGGPAGTEMTIDIQVDDVAVDLAAAMAQRLRRIVTVDHVLWSEKVQLRAA